MCDTLITTAKCCSSWRIRTRSDERSKEIARDTRSPPGRIDLRGGRVGERSKGKGAKGERRSDWVSTLGGELFEGMEQS